MHIFYCSEATTIGEIITLDTNESFHCTKVLRLRVDQTIMIVNGKGKLFSANLITVSSQQCTASIATQERVCETSSGIHIAISPTKNTDRFEWFVEKAVELGIAEITPIITEKGEREKINVDRTSKIIVTALKQSGQLFLPQLNAIMSFNDCIVQNQKTPFKAIAHCHTEEKNELFKEYKNQHKSIIVIGPEGDFTEKEINFALQKGFVPISLGGYRLRTETAGIVACHIVALRQTMGSV